MDQISLFDEKLLIKLPAGDYLYNSLVKVGDRIFYKQLAIENKPIDHFLYIPPSYSEICNECLKKGWITDLNEYGRCYLHPIGGI